MDVALLALRLMVGTYVFAHGAQKLFGWFGGGGLARTEQMMERLGFRPARGWALAGALSEVAGLAFALGLLTPLAVAGIASAMVTAIFSAHLGKSWFATQGGPELALTNLTVALAVGLAGPGRWSLDAALGLRFPQPVTLAVIAVVVGAGVAIAFGTRHRAAG